MSRAYVDPARSLGRLDRRVFGGFVEHLGRCIYGGLYEPGSPRSDANGFRTDVMQLLADLNMGVLRWPGGNFVSNYHWTDGIGPVSDRPRRIELAWGDVEPNTFGTDEFLRYCDLLGVEPYICLNMGTGSLEEALAWVEYCNGSADTAWTRQRSANGHPEPYGVSWWGLGNEMYGEWQVGALSASEYVANARRWARAIRMVDPGAKLVSCGLNGWSAWDREVIDGLVGLVDLHSIHIYTGSDDYWTNVLQPHQAERAIRTTAAVLRESAYAHGVEQVPRIAYDEWNVWFRTEGRGLEERYNFADALAVATYLNIFVRNCEWVAMANLAQMVNAIAPIVTTPTEAVLQSIYFPFLLHSQGALDLAADVRLDTPAVDGPPAGDHGRWKLRIEDLAPFGVLDVSATVDEARRRLSVTVVNRDPAASQPLEVRLRDWRFAGEVRLRTVQEGTASPSSVPGMTAVRIDDGTDAASSDVFSVQLPPASFAVLEAGIVPSGN